MKKNSEKKFCSWIFEEHLRNNIHEVSWNCSGIFEEIFITWYVTTNYEHFHQNFFSEFFSNFFSKYFFPNFFVKIFLKIFSQNFFSKFFFQNFLSKFSSKFFRNLFRGFRTRDTRVWRAPYAKDTRVASTPRGIFLVTLWIRIFLSNFFPNFFF